MSNCDSINWHEFSARRKLSLPDEWEAFVWTAIGYPHTKDVLVELGIPRILKSGKNKGQKTWTGCESRKCVVTDAELIAAQAEYERAGKCFKCYGTGERWAGWSDADGNTFVPCERCGATGEPKSVAAGGAA